jgi:hypothetical protein
VILPFTPKRRSSDPGFIVAAVGTAVLRTRAVTTNTVQNGLPGTDVSVGLYQPLNRIAVNWEPLCSVRREKLQLVSVECASAL